MSFLPPSSISLVSGPWATNGYIYSHISNGAYDLRDANGNSIGTGLSIEFTDNNGVLTLNVNPTINGSSNPFYFNAVLTSGVVTVGQSIALKSSNQVVRGVFIVPDFYTGAGGSGSTGGSGSSSSTTLKKVFCNFW